MSIFDPQTVDHFRTLTSRQTYLEVKRTILTMGGSSEDFLNAFTELVDAGLLSWDEIDRFESE